MVRTITQRSTFRSAALLVPAILMLMALATACGGGEPEFVGSRGRTLEVHIRPVEIVEKMAFSDLEGQHRVLRPKASNRLLALVEVTVVNRTSTVIPLLVDEEATQLGDRRTDRIKATDPFESAKVVDTADPDENLYAPLFWGEFELARDTQLTGWIVFDVPKGLKLGTLWWNEVDTILVDYEPRN